MSRRRRNNQTPKRRANTQKVARAQRAGGSQRVPTHQYQHFIPRFILRRFQVGLPKSGAEREKEFHLTGVSPEHVLYYDVATDRLDTLPIGKVYGGLGIYEDVQNVGNINELEDKLARLDSQAAPLITTLHNALPRGTLTLKRWSLEVLQKFLFVMYYRRESHSRCFQVDRPKNAKARQWIEPFMRATGIQSAAEMWRYFLKYYLDASHSDIMGDAARLIKTCGEERLQEMHIPSVTYRTYVDDYFLSIWEAADEEEFILTHDAFGLSEGSADSCPALHRIFVLSPRIAIVLCNVRLRPEARGYTRPSSLKSSLLNVYSVPPTPMYASRGGGTRLFARPRSSPKGEIDSFMFKITKLTRSQTLELNSVVLFNLEETGSVTFKSGRKMLRTAHAFRSNFPSSHLVVPLIARLTASMKTEALALRPPLQSPAAAPDEDFDPLSLGDLVLYVLLMQICSGRKQFFSMYDRAHFVLKIMANAKPTSFARGISRKVRRAFKACKGDMEDGICFAEGVNPAPLLPSISSESSARLFLFMRPYMSELGVVMSGDEGTLEKLQCDIAVVSFLQRASCNPGVWHALSCSSPEAPKILSRLFKKGTPGDRFIGKFSPSGFSSCYNRAYALRRVCGMAGPTTRLISQRYYELTASIIQSLDNLPEPYSSQPRKRPKARLVRNMSKAHSDLLMKKMKRILRVELSEYEPLPGEDTLDETLQKWVDEMAIVGCLAWLGKHRKNLLDWILKRAFPLGMDFKLFEDEEATGST